MDTLVSLPERSHISEPTPLGAIETDIAALKRDGFVVLRDLLSGFERRQLALELEPWLEITPRCQGDFYGWETTRLAGLLSKAPIVQHLALNARILAIAETMLRPACDCIQLNLTQATRVHPGERPQPPHADQEMWPWAHKGDQPWSINVMWSVTDFTRENGGTRIWPKSYKLTPDRNADPRDATAIEMSAGSALVFLGSLTHGAGANSSAAARTGVLISYAYGWLKTYENQYLAYPRDVVRLFPKRLQRLIGYEPHKPNLNNWEGQDPIAFLGEPSGAPRPHVDLLTPAIAEQLKAHYGG